MKPILFSSLALIFLFLHSHAASACQCIEPEHPTPEEVKVRFIREFNEASTVFSGEVISLDTFKVTFKIEKVWKGDAAGEIIMSTGTKDIGDGLHIRSACSYSFKVGERCLVYASGAGEEMQTRQCTGTGRLEDSEQRIKFLTTRRSMAVG